MDIWTIPPPPHTQWKPRPLDTSLPGSFPLSISWAYFHGLCNEYVQKKKGRRDWKSLSHLRECTFVPIRLHGHRWHPGKALTSVALTQWGTRWGTWLCRTQPMRSQGRDLHARKEIAQVCLPIRHWLFQERGLKPHFTVLRVSVTPLTNNKIYIGRKKYSCVYSDNIILYTENLRILINKT